jgi:hypothetical protein
LGLKNHLSLWQESSSLPDRFWEARIERRL